MRVTGSDMRSRCGADQRTASPPNSAKLKPGHSVELTPHPKLHQRLHRYPPTLADATDAESEHFQRWSTPTDAGLALVRQGRYGQPCARLSGQSCRSYARTVQFSTPAVAL